MPSVIKDSGVATSLTDPTTSDPVIPPDFSVFADGPSTGLWRRFAATADSPGRIGDSLLTSVPLAVLTALKGALTEGPRIPFWQTSAAAPDSC